MSLHEVIRPHVPPGCHPVETGRYNIPTNAINALGIELLNWIKMGVPGGIVIGRPRLGKTRAVQYLSQEIPSILQDTIPMFTISCNKYRYPSESTFYTDILIDLGHAAVTGRDAAVKRDRICKHLIASAQSSNQRRIILIFDDAQRLGDLQYEWLMDVHNQLDKHSINLSVFLVGQPNLRHKKRTFISEQQHQIVGRFMIHEHDFHGVRDLEDLRACLECYDEGSEFPAGSGWSYTKFFFPSQFERGLRLAQSAEDLWEVFEVVHTSAGLGQSVEIPMQYLAVTIQYVLTMYGIQGEDLSRLTKAHWKEAVNHSGYVLGEKYSYESVPGRDKK